MSDVPIYAGVGISICGNIMISLALNLQKYTHNKNDKAETNVPYVKRPLWWLGMALMLGGECGNFLAYAFAPPSVVAPLGTVALVSNCIIAPFALKERFRVQDFFGIVCAIGGAVTVVVSSAADEAEWSVTQLIEALAQIKFLVYMSVCIVMLAFLLVLSPKYGKRFLFIDMLIVGLFGGFTVISTKAISTMLTQGFLEMFTYWIFYVMLFVLVVTGVLQVKYLQKALQVFDSTEVIPMQFVMFTVFAILSGGILYDDFSKMAPLMIFIFLIGISCTFAGVFLISHGRKKLKALDAEQPDNAEATMSLTSGDADIPMEQVGPDGLPLDRENGDAKSKAPEEEPQDQSAMGKLKALFSPVRSLINRAKDEIAGIHVTGGKDEAYTSLGKTKGDVEDIYNDEEEPPAEEEEETKTRNGRHGDGLDDVEGDLGAGGGRREPDDNL